MGSSRPHRHDDPHEVVRAHRHAQNRERLVSEIWTDHGLVFCNELGELLDPSNVRRAMAELCERAGVPYYSSNELRHIFVTHKIDEGYSIEDVSDYARHSDTRIRRSGLPRPPRGSCRAAPSEEDGGEAKTGAYARYWRSN